VREGGDTADDRILVAAGGGGAGGAASIYYNLQGAGGAGGDSKAMRASAAPAVPIVPVVVEAVERNGGWRRGRWRIVVHRAKREESAHLGELERRDRRWFDRSLLGKTIRRKGPRAT